MSVLLPVSHVTGTNGGIGGVAGGGVAGGVDGGLYVACAARSAHANAKTRIILVFY